ncbi:MAG: hypothetical protein JW891_03815 [Candidatus Lokiarchaeota archaeon]|nr:hypothetical protein [Candidatus Lokiarchaeota archaeon]
MDFEVIFSGISSIIIVCLFAIIGIKIAFVYKKTKVRAYIFVGILLILIAESWYPSSISFIIAFFNEGQGLINYPQAYIVIGISLLPLGLFFWMLAMTDLMYTENQKVILVITFIIELVLEIWFFYGLFFDMSLIGRRGDSIVDGNYGLVSLIIQIVNLLFFLLTAAQFGFFSRKSDNPETKLKGTFFLLGVLCLGVGSVFDILSPGRILFLIIGRGILVISAIMFYLGFILPNTIKKMFIK